MIEGKVDILVVTETKLFDSTFPISQLYVSSFNKPCRLEGSKNSGRVLIYIREDIPNKELRNHLPNIEGIFIGLNLRKTNWLIFECYHPPFQSDDYLFLNIKNNLDKRSQKPNKYMLVGDFTA